MSFSPPVRYPPFDHPPLVQRDYDYGLNVKIITAALVVLLFIVLLLLALHVFAKWCWSRRLRRRRQWRRWSQEQGIHTGEAPHATLGLRKAIVESLPTFVYKTVPNQKDGLECAVCLCEFEENETGRLLPKCSHSFHTDCIDAWFLSNTTCPLCRTTADPSVPASKKKGECAVTNSSRLVLLAQNATLGSDEIHSDSAERATDPQAQPLSLTRPEQPFPYAVWRWRRSISDRFPYPQGVQFPTNVLFWGNHSHVSSRISSPRLEHGQIGGRSLPHTLVEITVSQDNFQTSPSSSFSHPGGSSTEGQSSPCSSEKEPLTSTAACLHAFSRLLSNKERKLSLADQDMNDSGCHV